MGREFGKPEDEQYQNCGLHGKDGKGSREVGEENMGMVDFTSSKTFCPKECWTMLCRS